MIQVFPPSATCGGSTITVHVQTRNHNNNNNNSNNNSNNHHHHQHVLKYYSDKGVAYQEKKEYYKAIHYFTLAIDLKVPQQQSQQQQHELLILRAQCWEHVKDYYSCVKDLTIAFQLCPLSVEALYHRARTQQYRIGNIVEAIVDYTMALRVANRICSTLEFVDINVQIIRDWTYINRASCFRRLHFLEAAQDDLKSVFKLTKDPAFCYQKGLLCHSMRDNQEAVEHMSCAIDLVSSSSSSSSQSVIAIDDDDSKFRLALCYHKRGRFYSDMCKFKESLSDFNRALELNPQNAKSYTRRGMVHYLYCRFQTAIDDFNKAIQLDSSLVTAIYRRALVHDTENRSVQALADLSLINDTGLDEANMGWYQSYRSTIRNRIMNRSAESTNSLLGGDETITEHGPSLVGGQGFLAANNCSIL